MLVATGSRLEVWDAESAAVAGSLRHRDLVAVDVSRDGRRVLVGTSSGTCMVVDPATLELGPKLYAGRRKLSPGALLAPDGRHYVQIGWDGNLVVRDIETGACVLQERDEGRILQFLACSADRSRFAWVSETADDAVIRTRPWPFTEDGPYDEWRLPGVRARADSLAIADDGRIALHESAAGTPDRISIWAAGARVVEREVDHGGTQRAIAWLPDGGLVASERAETGEDRLLALSPALETLWAFPLSYPCAATVSRSGEVIVAGSWEQGAVLRRQR